MQNDELKLELILLLPITTENSLTRILIFSILNYIGSILKMSFYDLLSESVTDTNLSIVL